MRSRALRFTHGDWPESIPRIDVDVVTDRDLNQPALSASLEQSLHSAGLVDPIVRVREVARIALDDRSGKVRRFIAL